MIGRKPRSSWRPSRLNVRPLCLIVTLVALTYRDRSPPTGRQNSSDGTNISSTTSTLLDHRLYSHRWTVDALSSTRPSRKSKSFATNKKTQQSLFATLQKSYTVESILQKVGRHLPSNELDPKLPSLTLVRLSKHMIAQRNNRMLEGHDSGIDLLTDSQARGHVRHVVDCLAQADWSSSGPAALESAVDGVKAVAVMARLLASTSPNSWLLESSNGIGLLWEPLMKKLEQESDRLAPNLQPHHLSGLVWSVDCFQLVRDQLGDKNIQETRLPPIIQTAYSDLDLPFRIRPGALLGEQISTESAGASIISVADIVDQVDFVADTIQTESKQLIPERRQTAWQGDEHVAPFAYSGKSMPRSPWSPVVEYIRNKVYDTTGHYYDGCLLNLYPDGGSAMRYHIDPDQGTLWGYETAVVSLGATRRFAFRPIDKSERDAGSKPHVFVLMTNDVTEMVRDCQSRFQHTVKTAEDKDESAPRVSLVFKKTL